MAVEDKYVNTDLGTGVLMDSKTNGGNSLIPIVMTEEIAAADDNGSVYRFIRVNSSDMIFSLEISNDAITAGTDYDVGLYDVDSGTVVDVNLFADALDLSSAGDRTNALTAPAIENLGKKVWELLGLTSDPQKQYDLAVTGVVVGSAAGTITIHLLKSN